MGIFPPNSKKYKNINNRKRKGKDKESYIFIVYTIFYIKISGGLLVFFDDELDDELTTFRNKNYRLYRVKTVPFICINLQFISTQLEVINFQIEK